MARSTRGGQAASARSRGNAWAVPPQELRGRGFRAPASNPGRAAASAMTQSVVVQGKGAVAPGPPAGPSPCLSRVSPLCSGTVREPGGMPLLGPGAAGTRRRQQGKGAAAPPSGAGRPRCFPRSSLWLRGAAFVWLN